MKYSTVLSLIVYVRVFDVIIIIYQIGYIVRTNTHNSNGHCAPLARLSLLFIKFSVNNL